MLRWFGRKEGARKRVLSGPRLYIPENLWRRMISHCQEERPLEACGILVGVGGEVEEGFATDNEHRSPIIYKVDDRQLLQVLKALRPAQQEVIAIYHSHLKTPPTPSQTDIAQATWPEAFYVIISLAKPKPQVRGWRIVDGQVTEHQVVVRKEIDGRWHDLRRAVQRAGAEPAKSSDIP